jgi:CRP/FNR family transcriptional regulator, cyclic AMP receptor protein
MKIDRGTLENHVKSFEPGEFVFQENEPGAEMYVILQGQVEIRKKTGGGSSKTLSVLGKGDLFGEMAIIERKPRSAAAMATQPTRLLVMNEGLYGTMVETNPDFARKMIRLLSDRIRKANQIIQDLMSTNRQNQIWSGLLAFAKESGVSTFKGHRVNLPFFLRWASERLGIGEKELQATLSVFLRRGIVKRSAAGHEEILVESREAVTVPEGAPL